MALQLQHLLLVLQQQHVLLLLVSPSFHAGTFSYWYPLTIRPVDTQPQEHQHCCHRMSREQVTPRLSARHVAT